MTDNDNTTKSEMEPEENENDGCGTTIIAVLVVIAMIIGIPACMAYQSDKRREKQYAYEDNLPKAPAFKMTIEQATQQAQSQVGKRIEYSLGDFYTETYTIDSVRCTKLTQLGVRKDKVTIEFEAYCYYFNGQLTFNKTEKLTYNFDKGKWEPYSGFVSEWIPSNLTVHN